MAAFQFTLQQVSFSSDEISVETSSVDSLGSVVDANVDFIMDSGEHKDNDIIEEWKSAVKHSPVNNSMSNSISDTLDTQAKLPQHVPTPEINCSYPTIPLAVAQYMNESNPSLYQEAEKYFHSEGVLKSSEKMPHVPENETPPSPLRSMAVASEALALQHSVIGNLDVKPVSADIVAQVVADTRRKLQQQSLNTSHIPNTEKPVMSIENEAHKQRASKPELIRYPPESITSVVERRSWFSSSENVINNTSPTKTSPKKHLSRNNSQSSVASNNNKKSNSKIHDVPKIHTRKMVNKHSSDVTADSPYEVYPESSVDYETESSVSEKFEVESLCSEAFETESNISEVSGLDDEMFQLKRRLDESILNHNEPYNTQVNVSTSPMKTIAKLTCDKMTETEESDFFKLWREKASLEGRLESAIQGQDDFVKERDQIRSVVVTLEAQVKSLEGQLETAIAEKKHAVKQLDMQVQEHKNWDNVIKEYQSIIESKNAEIKGLKEDLSESEQANTRAKINYEELKVDMESRDGAILGLKKKIAELHVEVQVLLQNKIQSENELKNIRLEMETLQKSKEWYQEQLHIAQESRNKLHQELISTQADYVSLSNSLDKIASDNNMLKQQLIEAQRSAVTEKEVLMKHLESIEADMRERESLFEEMQKDKGNAEQVLANRIRKIEDEKSRLTNLTFTVSDLDYQLKAVKSECQDKQNLIAMLEKEKAELSKQVAILQKSTIDKDLSVEHLKQEVKDINTKLRHTEQELARSEELVINLKNEVTATAIAFASANEEKRVIDESLKLVSDNLNKFQNNFKQMKTELVAKTSQAEQLLKEKQILEEAIKKNEDSILFLRREFEQQAMSDNQSKEVMLDDLKKKKCDVENVLDVYSKDILNYQQTIRHLEKQKNDLNIEISKLISCVQNQDGKMNMLDKENISLKQKLEEYEKLVSRDRTSINEQDVENDPDLKLDNLNCDKSVLSIINKYKKRLKLYKRNIDILSRQLKERIECERLNNEVKVQNEVQASEESKSCPGSCEFHGELISVKKDFCELENKFKQQQIAFDKQKQQLKANEETIIELEREKGKVTGIADKCESLKKHVVELESKLAEKDTQVVQLSCLVEELNERISETELKLTGQHKNLEQDLNKEKTLVKSLRMLVFQEKRSSSQLQRELTSLKSALEKGNQFADSKKLEIDHLQAELSLKMQAELKHRAETEQFQTEIRLNQSEVEKLNKELEEVKARDPALAEQLKSLSWHLKGKSNEAMALKEKLKLVEERHQSEISGLKNNWQKAEAEIHNLKQDLNNTRKEKFNYQSKVMDLRKAIKSQLKELELEGVLKLQNKSSNNGPSFELNIPDPEVSFDEAYINSLLQKDLNFHESRPLTDLQACLNSLKQEMAQLQQKIIDNAEAS